MSEKRDEGLDGRKQGALGSKDVVYTNSLLMHDVGCLFMMGIVLLWLGEDQCEQNHENNETTGSMIASDFNGGSGKYSST